MDIFISRKGENLGPFSLKEIHDMVANGEASATDHAWHDGMDEWGPLSRILAKGDPVPTPPPPPIGKDPEPSVPQPSAPPRSSKLRSPGSTPPPAAKERHSDADVRLRTPDVIVKEVANPDSKHKRGVVAMPETIHVRKSKVKNFRFSVLRLLAVPGIVLMLYAMFLPWVHVEDEEGGVYSRATAAELSLSEEFQSEPLGIENPKTFPHIARLCMVCALLGCLVVSLLCLKLAFRQNGVLPFAPLVVSLVTVALVGSLGILYGVNLENSTDTIITMDIGYYLALGIAVFAVAMILVPELGRLGQLFTLFLPPIGVTLIAASLVYYGYGIGKRASTSEAGEGGTVEVLKSPAKVIEDIKEFYSEATS
jgi:uncharacterized membrane protein YqaE (UPF0057 family)